MSNAIADIFDNLRSALAATGVFAQVTIGPDADSPRRPRAEILPVSVQTAPADDSPQRRWTTVTARVIVQAQAATPAAAVARATELVQAAQAALLADRFRGKRCCDLPGGRATELGTAAFEPSVKPPFLAAGFEVRCRFETEDQ